MLKFILALATLALIPNVQFTEDSVYKQNDILTITVQETRNDNDELVQKDLIFAENPRVGYRIYDNPNTPYIDGLKVDDQWVTNWIYEDYDDTVEHTVYVKTEYTEDYAGLFLAAKDGNWKYILNNPMIIVQYIPYLIAFLSLLLSIFSTKKKKGVTTKEVATTIENTTLKTTDAMKTAAMAFITGTFGPAMASFKTQQENIIKALLLQSEQTPDARLQMINLLKEGVEDGSFIENIQKQIQEDLQKGIDAAIEKEKALLKIKEISEIPVETKKEDGTSI